MTDAAPGLEIQDRLRKVVQKIQGLPTLPSMLKSINKMILNPHVAARDVAQVISSDPPLASKVLRVVNSSFYGFPNRISTITHAIVILGFNTIKSIVLSSTIFDVFRAGSRAEGFDRAALWRHSIGCAAAARAVGQRVGHPLVEELFIAGLLHDVGKIVVDQYLPDKFAEVVRRVRAGNLLFAQAEQEALGITHAEIGAWLFEKWNLSRALVEAVRCHHAPELAGDHAQSAQIVHVADVLVRALRFGSGGDPRVPPLSEAAWSALGLSIGDMEPLLESAGAEIEKAAVFVDFIQ